MNKGDVTANNLLGKPKILVGHRTVPHRDHLPESGGSNDILDLAALSGWSRTADKIKTRKQFSVRASGGILELRRPLQYSRRERCTLKK